MPDKKIKIALISNDLIGKEMAGPGIRYFEMAKVLSNHFQVILFVPDKCDLEPTNFSITTYHRYSSSIAEKLHDFDYVIAQNLRPPLIKKIKKLGIRYITDQYDPMIIETLEYTKEDNSRIQNNTFQFMYQTLILQLKCADHILCASGRQKDFYFGILASQKMINPKTYQNSNFNNYITIFPFGIPSDKPIADKPSILEEQFPQIKPTDKIIYWGGGVWNWFDPLSVVKAIEIISQKRDDVKLFFLGTKHPNPKIKTMSILSDLVDYCQKQGLLDKKVFFNTGWTPYPDRANYLLRSSIGISTHFENLETHFSFRTRILDYLWAKLPIIATQGDAMADLIEKKQLGLVVPYKNSQAIATAITQLLDNQEFYEKCHTNIAKIQPELTWENLAGELIDKIQKDQISFHPLKPLKFSAHANNFYYYGLKKKFLK